MKLAPNPRCFHRSASQYDDAKKLQCEDTSLLRFLDLHASASICDLNVELCGAIDDSDTVAQGDIVCDFGAVGAILHHEDFEFANVVHKELVKTVGQHVPGLFV